MKTKCYKLLNENKWDAKNVQGISTETTVSKTWWRWWERLIKLFQWFIW